MKFPRRFLLIRDEDVTGVSGTGVVAAGVLFPPTRAAELDAEWSNDLAEAHGGEGPGEPNRQVALQWLTEWPTSVVFHERGVESLERIHGHNGATRIVWLDPDSVGVLDVGRTLTAADVAEIEQRWRELHG